LRYLRFICLSIVYILRISDKYGSVPLNNDPTKNLRWGFKTSTAHPWSEFFLKIRHQFHSYSSIKLNLSQSANINLKVFRIYVMLFQSSDSFHKDLFRVRLPYLLLICSYHLRNLVCVDNIHTYIHTTHALSPKG
jgi:hypothetical protein